MLIVGVLTEKYPFADVNVTETLVKVAYVPVFTSFWITTFTVFVSPKFIAEGSWL